jgi:hypothetical protein
MSGRSVSMPHALKTILIYSASMTDYTASMSGRSVSMAAYSESTPHVLKSILIYNASKPTYSVSASGYSVLINIQAVSMAGN